MEEKENIRNLFQFMLMDHTKSRDIKNKLVICYPNLYTVGLTKTPNYDPMTVYNTDDDE